MLKYKILNVAADVAQTKNGDATWRHMNMTRGVAYARVCAHVCVCIYVHVHTFVRARMRECH